MVHLPAKTLKVCPRQFGEALSLQPGPECRINAPRLSRLPASLRPFLLGTPPARVYYSSKSSRGCVAVRLMSTYARLFYWWFSGAQSADSRMRIGGSGSDRGRLSALWASWRGDLFPPDCPLCHSNVRSSWMTSLTPPPSHPSLSLFARVLRPTLSTAARSAFCYFATRLSRRWSSLDTQERISTPVVILTQGWEGASM